MSRFWLSLQHRFLHLLRHDKGQGMVEYGLILALIAIIAIVALSFLGHSVGNQLGNVASQINNP